MSVVEVNHIVKANELLNQTGMLPHKGKRIDELSKGMCQIIQFIVTIIHNLNWLFWTNPWPVSTRLTPSY